MAVNTERDQLAEDILYLEYLIDVEKNDIKRKLTQRLAQLNSEDERVDAICDEISSSLAQISARVSVLEKVLVTRGEEAAPDKSASISHLPVEEVPGSEVQVTVEDIAEQNFLTQVKYSDAGMPYVQIMPDSHIKIDLSVDRSSKKTLAINVFGDIDHAFLNKVQILVDGERLKFKVARVKDDDRLICHLPVLAGRRKTQIEIITPNVSSGSLCVSDIHCVRRQTLSGYVKQLKS